MDDATETIVKIYQACVVHQPLNKYTPLQPNLYLVVLEWKVHWISLVQSMENPIWLISIIIHPIWKRTVYQEVTSREEIIALTDTFVRSGFPEELVSDKGRQFVCGESEAFLKSCGIKHIRVFPYYARSNGRLEENFRAAISEGKSWQTESPRNSCATEQIGFKLVEDHLVCFCSIANFEQNSIIGTRSRTLVKMQFVANAFEGISR